MTNEIEIMVVGPCWSAVGPDAGCRPIRWRAFIGNNPTIVMLGAGLSC